MLKVDSDKAKHIGLTALVISNMAAFILLYMWPDISEIHWFSLGMLLLNAIGAAIWLLVI